MILQKSTPIPVPFMRQLVMFAEIAMGACYNNIFRTIRSTSRKRNDMIDVVSTTNLFAAVVTTPLLPLILLFYIFFGIRTLGRKLTGFTFSICRPYFSRRTWIDWFSISRRTPSLDISIIPLDYLFSMRPIVFFVVLQFLGSMFSILRCLLCWIGAFTVRLARAFAAMAHKWRISVMPWREIFSRTRQFAIAFGATFIACTFCPRCLAPFPIVQKRNAILATRRPTTGPIFATIKEVSRGGKFTVAMSAALNVFHSAFSFAGFAIRGVDEAAKLAVRAVHEAALVHMNIIPQIEAA